MVSEPPQDCGRRLLPSLVDSIAKQDPDRVFVSIARSIDPEDGFRDISFGVFARAVNRCAGWVEQQLGRSTTYETIAYLGPLDLRYAILLFAALKTGHKAFFPSPRNSLAAHLDLLEAAQCKAFAVPDPIPNPAQAILAAKSYPTRVIPSLEALLDEQHVPDFPFRKSFEEARFDPLVVLHTSGSTGIPKIVTMNHGTFAAMDAQQLIPWRGGNPTVGESWRGLRFFLGFPLFHAATLSCLLGMGIYWDVIWVIGPPVPLTATLVDKVHRFGNVQASALPPSILVDLCKDKAQADRLCSLKQIIYGGGPLPEPTGHFIAARTTLTTTMGATETAILPMQPGEPHEWNYLSYNKELGHEFIPIAEADGLYELVMLRQPEYDAFQGVFSTFPDADTYSTKDTYSKHPTKPGLWKYEGRRDDVIAFSNGEKLNPVSMEAIISSHKKVSTALIGRHGAFQASVLVEPVEYPKSTVEEQALIDDIWPSVQEANRDCPAHGRIMKDLILIATKDKPFPRSAKMTVQRKLTLKLYERELDDLYAATMSDGRASSSFVLDGDWSKLTTRQALKNLVAMVSEDSRIEFEDDLFTRGFDSLLVITLSRYINLYLARYRSDLDLITSKTIYAHPSIAKIEEFLENSGRYRNVNNESNPSAQLQRAFEQFSLIGGMERKSECESMHVVLTGSTGNLGSYLLDLLIRDDRVARVYCLNRNPDAQELQMRIHKERRLAIDFGKALFYNIDLSRSHLGLSDLVYQDLSRQVSHVLHTAWDVNTNMNLDSYMPTHLHGCQQIISLVKVSSKRAIVLFTSSFESVNNWHAENFQGPVPEAIFDDWKLPRSTGYAGAKAVAERMFAHSNINAKVCRLAQLSGPGQKHGTWNKQAWIPSMIASSLHLNQLPVSLGAFSSIDWVPVDLAAQILLQILMTPSKGPVQVYHVVNPQRSQWSDLVPVVQKMYPATKAVSLPDWVRSVKDSALQVEEIKDHSPAAKMLPFFEELRDQDLAGAKPVWLDARHAMAVSDTLRTLPPVNGEMLQTWLRQWHFGNATANGRL